MARFVNMNGSDDPYYRYTMPAVVVKHEGGGKMKKSVLVNLLSVSAHIGQTMDALLQHLGQSLNARCTVEGTGKGSKPYITGHHATSDVQSQVLAFVRDFVLCRHCGIPETTLVVGGSKKQRTAVLDCKGCGKRTSLDTELKCVKHMMQHASTRAVKGHAAAAPTVEAMFADEVEERGGQSCEKRRCACGHRTSKPVCKRCGAELTAGSAEVPDAAVVGPCAAGELAATVVSKWMQSQCDEISDEVFSDFVSTMLSSGFGMDASLTANIATCLSQEAVTTLPGASTQPIEVCRSAIAVMERWVPLLDRAVADLGSTDAVLDSILFGLAAGLCDGIQEQLVGLLLGLQRHTEQIGDEQLAAACQRLPVRGVAMQKFIDFLREDSDGSAGESDG